MNKPKIISLYLIQNWKKN